jgi:hypothetical protein
LGPPSMQGFLPKKLNALEIHQPLNGKAFHSSCNMNILSGPDPIDQFSKPGEPPTHSKQVTVSLPHNRVSAHSATMCSQSPTPLVLAELQCHTHAQHGAARAWPTSLMPLAQNVLTA